ncbi:MAG: efflux RND transporter periplasmic adaptor subunit [Myxococcota bacterium]
MTRRHFRFGLCSLACVAMLGSLAGCREEQTAAEEILPSVAVVEIEAVDFDQDLRASGDLRARYQTMIAAEVAGRVTELSVEEGASVAQGDVVIRIDPERRRLDLAAAQARLSQARANLRQETNKVERVRKLRSENISSVERLEEAETAVLLAQSAVRAEEAAVGVARRALEDASVAAPFAGLVARRSVELGEFVQPGTPLFELVSMTPLDVVFNLPELDSQRVSLGQHVAVAVAAPADRRFDAVVTFIAPTVDPDTRTLRIKAEIDNSDGALRPGLFARVMVGTEERRSVLMVPEEAVVQREGGAWIFRVEAGNRVRRVAVETGAQSKGRIEVRGAVTAGDRVVRRGHGGLADGMEVVVRGTESTALETAGSPRTGAQS